MKKHIIAIRLFASYYLFFGVTNLFLGVIGILSGGFAALTPLDFAVSVYAFGIAPFLLLIGIGLLLFKEWARRGFIAIVIIKVSFTIGKSIFMYSNGNLIVQGMILGIILTSIIHAVMIFYFMKANVKSIFIKGVNRENE